MDTKISFEDYFSAEDQAWIENLAAFWDAEEQGYKPFTDDDKLARLCANMADRLLDSNPRGVEWLLERNPMAKYRYGDNPTFRRLAVMSLEYGVACKDGACANYLGAMHVRGVLVEKDLRRAVELYQLGERMGVAQSAVNLGYAYEYGWLDEPDYVRAYMQYAKVASLGQHPEALYKMGDMYNRAYVVERDLHVAYLLYRESYLKAGDGIENKAQAAFRMAQLEEDPNNQDWDVPYDPLHALELYQLAERGLRVAIAHGYDYYAPRLQEALEGQERVRTFLSSGEYEL